MHEFSNFLGYIDPGTGSMLFTIIIGVATAAVFGIRGLMIKLKYGLKGGKVSENVDRIPLVIFSDSKRYWNVFGPICRELDKRGVDAQYWTMSEDDPAFKEDLPHITCQFIGESNSAFAKLNIMNAKLCLSTTPGLDVLQWKRSKKTEKYIHVYHDTSDGTIYRMFGIDHYDAVLASGPAQITPIRELEKQRNLPAKEITLAGATFMDSLKARVDAKKAESGSSAAKDSKTILCAPSWGVSAILNKFGEKFIDALIDTGYEVIIRPHPQSVKSEKEMLDALMAKYPDGEKIKWNFDNDNFDVLWKSDILISDFSSVMFDFALAFDKPVISADTSFDPSPYDAAWLEEQPWTFRILDKIGVKLSEDDFGRMKEVIDNCTDSPEFAAGREQARADVWCNMGHATETICDYLVDELVKKEEPVQDDVKSKKVVAAAN